MGTIEQRKHSHILIFCPELRQPNLNLSQKELTWGPLHLKALMQILLPLKEGKMPEGKMPEGKMFEVDTVFCLVCIQKPQILMHTIKIAGACLSY